MDLPGPGAGSTAIGHVADGLTSSAGQSLRAPVAGRYLGTDAALVPVAETMRWGGVTRLGGLVAALIAIVPVSVIALRMFPMVFVLRNAAIEVVVPFPMTRATFVMPWGGEISEASVVTVIKALTEAKRGGPSHREGGSSRQFDRYGLEGVR